MVGRGKKHRDPYSLVRMKTKASHRDVHVGGKKIMTKSEMAVSRIAGVMWRKLKCV